MDYGWASAKTTPLPTTSGYYRSRIYTTDVGVNQLIAASDQLLSFIAIATQIDYPEDSNKLLQDLAHEVRSFEHCAQRANYSVQNISAARYAMCCLLDEVIAGSEWGQKHNWLKNGLLSMFFGDKKDPKIFFAIVENALSDVANNLHLIELLYLCLSFGFTGKYQGVVKQPNELLALKNQLYQAIGQYGLSSYKSILVHAHEDQPVMYKEHPRSNERFWWWTIGLTAMIGVAIYLGFGLKLYYTSKPLYTAIKHLAKHY